MTEQEVQDLIDAALARERVLTEQTAWRQALAVLTAYIEALRGHCCRAPVPESPAAETPPDLREQAGVPLMLNPKHPF